MKKQRSILTASLGLLLLAGCGGGLRSGEVRALGQSAEEKELLALTSTGERSRAAYSCAWDGASDQLKLELLSWEDGAWTVLADLGEIDFEGSRDPRQFGLVVEDDALTVNVDSLTLLSVSLDELRPQLVDREDWAVGWTWSEGGVCTAGERLPLYLELRSGGTDLPAFGGMEHFSDLEQLDRFDHAYAVTAVLCTEGEAK